MKAKLAEWGQQLFEGLFGLGRPGRDAYQQARGGECELMISSHSPEFLSLPWELLWDPQRPSPLALELSAIDRTLDTMRGAASVRSDDVLRMLMVIARPSGPSDIGHQLIARHLLERLAEIPGRIELDILRPPTLTALGRQLNSAKTEGQPYHVLHFDGHGSFHGVGGGWLAFEAPGGGEDPISAEAFALEVRKAEVPLVVLNACRSGMLAGRSAAGVATRLLQEGAASVVAMGYSIQAAAAAEFMAAFYEALFSGKAVSEAVTEGRWRLYLQRERPRSKGLFPGEHWMLPVSFLRSDVRFQHLKWSGPKELKTLKELINEVEQTGSSEEDLSQIDHFVGRDAAFYTLELALKWQRVVVLHGVLGIGKTELARAFGRWWRTTGGLQRPTRVFVHDFRLSGGSFDQAVIEIGRKLLASDFEDKVTNPVQRQGIVLRALEERSLLLLWDAFENVRSMRAALAVAPAQDQDTQVQNFLMQIAHSPKHKNVRILIVSRGPEEWVSDVRRIKLGGLNQADANELADHVMAPYAVAQTRRSEKAYTELVNRLGGHPLSLRRILLQLEESSAAAVVAALRGESAALHPDSEAAVQVSALMATLSDSWSCIPESERDIAVLISLLQRYAAENLCEIFSTSPEVPKRFRRRPGVTWPKILVHMSEVGLLARTGNGIYELLPPLPAFLLTKWREAAGNGFDAERKATEQALLNAYASFGDRVVRKVRDGVAKSETLALVEPHRPTMERLLDVGLSERRYAETRCLLEPLREFWYVRGLKEEALSWIDRIRNCLEDEQGVPPPLDGDAGALWQSSVQSEAEWASLAGDIHAAYRAHDAIRRQIENSAIPHRDHCLAATYYRLSMLAEARGDAAAALEWVVRCVALFPDFPNSDAGSGSQHLVQLAGQLGLAALETTWQHCIGKPLPDDVRRAVQQPVHAGDIDPDFSKGEAYGPGSS